MRVHHLNCASMAPWGGRLVNGAAPWYRPASFVAHCLLVETNQNLVLIDTGLGVQDVRNPATLNRQFRLACRPLLDESETAIRQITALGYAPTDVRHIVVTHLDLDHSGGLPDFPWATVHVQDSEYRAAMARSTRQDRARYEPRHWAHQPQWARYAELSGEKWYGFSAVRQLTGLSEEILLIPLSGHTHGHSGVAIQLAHDQWLLHAGDAYFFHEEVNAAQPRVTPGLAFFQTIVETERIKRLANQRRLHQLAQSNSARVNVISAHDPVEFARAQLATS